MSGSGDRHDVVLGLTGLSHDPAACLVVDGELVAAVEEERLNRQKRTIAFPHRSIDFVLAHAGLTMDDVSDIAFYWDDRGQFARTMWHSAAQLPANPGGMLRILRQRLGTLRAPALLARELAVHRAGDVSALPPIRPVAHHEAHLAAAVLSAPFEPDAGLVVDGRGEIAATTLYRLGGATTEPVELESFPFPNSLGVFFGAVTQLLGGSALSDEYKVMGLASYGRPDARATRRVERLMRVLPDGRYQVNTGLLRPERCSTADLPWLAERAAAELRGGFREDGRFTQEARDFAYAAQNSLERAITGLVRRLVARTGARRLVITGGVAMNARAIGRLRAEGLVDQLHVPLAPTDAGASVGAALALLRRSGRAVPRPAALVDPFLGPRFSDGEIEELLVASGWHHEHCADVASAAAEAIAGGRVVGWFDGRMEFGERALGARSILGDPRSAETRDRINASVKRRESYRPFAPSVLEEESSHYFHLDRSRRMGEITRVTALAAREVPAVVHVDGTARPQTVPADWPVASFRRLIERFRDLTGTPMVVNTSFNVHDEPIVCTPEDALRCFATSGLDLLFIGPFLVRKGTHRV
ncbi:MULTISPECIES: carbamoyltransferase C-terminal domain-containing protein [Actinosynnema]|uniref:carbamoyltransferase family protein n=1 Tax=Actinosynnema TaxID=40566 RepID=UPI0020A2669E|nr:carbamoyltransferase C-terminal domain-containing protein [Actinosynnema pretiosum]MCP2097839.1 carbamoyltransferase [Actinosynnema pretiosum]